MVFQVAQAVAQVVTGAIGVIILMEATVLLLRVMAVGAVGASLREVHSQVAVGVSGRQHLLQ